AVQVLRRAGLVRAWGAVLANSIAPHDFSAFVRVRLGDGREPRRVGDDDLRLVDGDSLLGPKNSQRPADIRPRKAEERPQLLPRHLELEVHAPLAAAAELVR